MSLTEAQRAALVNLRSQHGAKFTEITAMLSLELGHGDVGKTGPKIRKDIVDQAHEAIDKWTEEAELDRREEASGEPPTPFQRLLREYSDLGEQISDILNEGAAAE